MEVYKCSRKMKSTMNEREAYVKEIQKKMILSFTELIEKRDVTTGKHVKRTGVYVKILAHDMVLSHHEKWDGSGYPQGIAGEDIPLSARIMAVADVFEALVSKRCYKEACSYEQAFDIIRNLSGTHFDPVLVEAFLNRKEEVKHAG